MKEEMYKKYIAVVQKNLEIYLQKNKETGKSESYLDLPGLFPKLSEKTMLESFVNWKKQLDSHTKMVVEITPIFVLMFAFLKILEKYNNIELKEAPHIVCFFIVMFALAFLQESIINSLVSKPEPEKIDKKTVEKKEKEQEQYQNQIPQKLKLFGYELSKTTLICPISLEYFEYPVFNKESGHSYENSDFEKVIKAIKKDPVTKASTKVSDGIPNVLLYQTLQIILSSEKSEKLKEEIEKVYTCPITGKLFAGKLYILCGSGITISEEGLTQIKGIDPITGKEALPMRNHGAETFLQNLPQYEIHAFEKQLSFSFFSLGKLRPEKPPMPQSVMQKEKFELSTCRLI